MCCTYRIYREPCMKSWWFQWCCKLTMNDINVTKQVWLWNKQFTSNNRHFRNRARHYYTAYLCKIRRTCFQLFVSYSVDRQIYRHTQRRENLTSMLYSCYSCCNFHCVMLCRDIQALSGCLPDTVRAIIEHRNTCPDLCVCMYVYMYVRT